MIFADLGDSRVTWLNFQGLDQAIAELLGDETELLAEQTRFLLHELRSLFAHEGLIGQEDTVVVAAKDAYPEYRRLAAYVCQAGRSFREGIGRMGFYYDGAIQPEIPLIRHRRDNVIFSADAAAARRESNDPAGNEIASLIDQLLAEGTRVPGQSYQVFLLSELGADETLLLDRAITNTTTDRKGNPWAWTLGQRYTQAGALERGATTTTELERLGG
jgi:hypothetical protein